MDDLGYQGRSTEHQERMFRAGNPVGIAFIATLMLTIGYLAAGYMF